MASREKKPFGLRYEMGERPDDLIACIVLALTLVVLVYLLPEVFLRQILGLVFVLFLPGYAATAALFPENEQIDGIERVALSFGLSIAIVPLIGLALNFTPWGIRLDPILASVSAFIVGVSIIAWYRRSRLPKDERFTIKLDIKLDFKGMPLVDRLLTIGIVVMLVASVVVLAWAVTTPRVGERFTQLAILGPDGVASNYPRNLTIGQEATVLVSVRSYEHEPANYTMVLVLTTEVDYNFTVGDFDIDWNGSHALSPFTGIAQKFSLDHLDYYNQTFNFSATAGGTWKLQFLLYKDDQLITPEYYREVHLWLDVT